MDLVRNLCHFLYVNDHTYFKADLLYGTVGVPEESIKHTTGKGEKKEIVEKDDYDNSIKKEIEDYQLEC